MTTRREVIAGLAGLAAPLLGGSALAAPARGGGGEPFSWERLQAQALALSREAYRAPPPPHPRVVDIDYDAANRIRYREDRTVWGDGGVRFFPVIKMASRSIQVLFVEQGVARPFPYQASLFSVPRGHPLSTLGDRGGFSGFRVMNPGGHGDWLAFQGGSYFRTAGPLSQYGLSARGLAINSGTTAPEEFPDFTHFWLERGADGAVIVHALLNGPSVTGAFRFVNSKRPDEIEQKVNAVIFLRHGIDTLGMAPLTSMFWYGEGDRPQVRDWRPEIHDSDGLAIRTGAGERIWRPLTNPSRAITLTHLDRNPRGFGLLQRDRNFDHYQDDGVFYEKRPSLWVEPIGDWGAGSVALYTFPTSSEYDDNVVAYWTPAVSPAAGARLAWDYRLRWIGGEPEALSVARAVNCWRGPGNVPGKPPRAGIEKIVVDFQGDRLDGLDHRSSVKTDISLSAGRLVNEGCYSIDGQKGLWRMIMDIERPSLDPIDIRACLRLGNEPITETWLFTLT